jgi:type I restriction enzyme S subunit
VGTHKTGTHRREAVTKGLDKSAPMKDSGVDWIGEVPAHWEVTKTKWMFEIVKRLYDKEDRDVLSITQRGLKVKDIESNDGQLAESYIGYQIVNVNDFAMNSMDLLTGWVDCSPYEGVTSPDYRVFRFLPSKPQCHNYYKYLFQMCYKNRIFYRLGQGVSNFGRWRLQADQFLNIRLPQPPCP